MEITNVDVQLPCWAGHRQIDEQLFCQEFGQIYNLCYTEGAFFCWKGMLPEEQVKKLIYDSIKPYYSTNLAAKTNRLLESLKMELCRESLPLSDALILCANGAYNVVTGRFCNELPPCRFRLPVNYNEKAPKPELWQQFLRDLLEPEDILTLQEFLGYCLLPINYGQKMLLILGRGGEGKSRIGVVASKLFGPAMVNGSLTKLEKNPFSRADLQHRLLMVDDDLQLEALTTTGNIKSIITAEHNMDLEKKGVQSYQGRLFCRLMAFGNGNLRSLHDRSYGFFRRQIILTTRPRPEDRQDNPFLAQEMVGELEGILLWCIEGLNRLLDNDLHFTISSRARRNLQEAIQEGNNALEFLASQGYIRLDPEAEISTRRLYSIYTDWCQDNTLTPLSARTFCSVLQAEAHRFGLTYTNRIAGGNDRLVRGFRGIRSSGMV